MKKLGELLNSFPANYYVSGNTVIVVDVSTMEPLLSLVFHSHFGKFSDKEKFELVDDAIKTLIENA